MQIKCNKIYKSKNEKEFILNTLETEYSYDKEIKQYLNTNFGYKNTLLTSSATTALDAIAIALDLNPEDEIILPSYTLSSTANSFALRGAKLVFADSENDNPNIDIESIKNNISDKTKVIIIVHYAGIPCNITETVEICKRKNIILIEDAAQAFNSFYNKKPIGTFSDFAIFSFHNTKNITCGEGGALIVNNLNFYSKIESILNKGTNLNDFKNNKVDKYEWTNLGISGSLSEINKAYLFSQLLDLKIITETRKHIWEKYNSELSKIDTISTPKELPNTQLNYHIFYIVCKSKYERTKLQNLLSDNNIETLFHFNSLHKSIFFKDKYSSAKLINTDKFSDCLLRLPLNTEISESEQNKIISLIVRFYKK